MSAILNMDNKLAPFIANERGQNSLLRFITCGSVDDGKSTLIGRLLHDTGAVFEDQLETFHRDSRKFGTTGGDLDFSLLVDGLSAEREQGITIDVAYRYFSTPQRAFIIADTPGHEQYTRNMATGASQADLAIILIDARKGVLPQTRRHSFITSMVGIRSVVIAVNKMDLVDYDEQIFRRIEREYRSLLPRLNFRDVTFIPMSAKLGINVATHDAAVLDWYEGPTLLEHLETVSIPQTGNESGIFRLPVQWVNRPNLDFRGFSGTVAGGTIHIGDTVTSLPSGQKSRVREIYNPDGLTDIANADEAITLRLEDEIDTSRGDVLVGEDETLLLSRALKTEILWMSATSMTEGQRLLLKLANTITPIEVARLEERVDIHSYYSEAADSLATNEIGHVYLNLERPIVAAPYQESRALGAFILIDPVTNETVALGAVRNGFQSPFQKTTETRQSSTIGNIYNAWLGTSQYSAKQITVWRFAISLVIVFIASIFGIHFSGAAMLFALDFLLRPFARFLIVSKTKTGNEDLEGGAGI